MRVHLNVSEPPSAYSCGRKPRSCLYVAAYKFSLIRYEGALSPTGQRKSSPACTGRPTGGWQNRAENAVTPPRSLLILDGGDRKGEAGIFVGGICMYMEYKEIPCRRRSLRYRRSYLSPNMITDLPQVCPPQKHIHYYIYYSHKSKYFMSRKGLIRKEVNRMRGT